MTDSAAGSASIAQVFSLLDPPLWLVTSRAGPRRGGLTATLVSQASIVPDHPRVLVGLSPQHHTTHLVQRGRTFTLHLVDESHRDLVWTFGTASGHDGDKFIQGTWTDSPLGNPRLASAVAWLDCEIEQSMESGDRIFFLARVRHGERTGDGPALTLRPFLAGLTPKQQKEIGARLTRDAAIDAELIRQFQRLNSPDAIRS